MSVVCIFALFTKYLNKALMEVFKSFSFDAAHFLPNVGKDHKCFRLHGHTYHLTVFAEKPLDEHKGWVIDFADLKDVVKPVVDTLDHQYLNEIAGLENPTCELIAKWLWDQIKPKLDCLKKIELRETPTSGVIYSGE